MSEWDEVAPPPEPPPEYARTSIPQRRSNPLVGICKPYSEDIERQVLGILLFDDTSAKRVIERLKGAHFHQPHHRLIFEAAVRAFDDHGAVDSLLVAEQLRAKDQLETVGGLAKLAMMSEDIATTAHLEQHMATLERLKRDRDTLNACIESLSGMIERDLGADEVIPVLKERLTSIESSSDTGANHCWRDVKYLDWSNKPPEWILEPFISPQDIFILSGDSGTGKSFFFADLMLSVAMGLPWLGKFPTRKVRCLYLDFDGHTDSHLLRLRLQYLLKARGIDGPPYSGQGLEDTFSITSRFHLPRRPNLYTGENLLPIKRDIMEGRYDLVFLDTLASVHGVDNENDAGKMGIAMNRLKDLTAETNIGLAIAHHHRKPSQMGNEVVGSKYRGSTVIKDNSDSMIEMKKERFDVIRLTHSKPRYLKQLPDIAAKIYDVNAANPADGIFLRLEDTESLLTTRRDDATKWILNDLWKLVGSTVEVPQKDIIRLAHEQGVGSDKLIREALTHLSSRGLVLPSSEGKFHTKVWTLVVRDDG